MELAAEINCLSNSYTVPKISLNLNTLTEPVIARASVADPERFDADPDPDPNYFGKGQKKKFLQNLQPVFFLNLTKLVMLNFLRSNVGRGVRGEG